MNPYYTDLTKLVDVYTNVQSNSSIWLPQNLFFNESTQVLSILNNGNSVTLSSLANNISFTQTVFASAIALSTVTFTGETKTSTTSVTATDTYVKVIVEGQTKYLRLFDVI